MEKKPYRITDRAGWFVAGRKVPSRRDEDGNVVPLVGHVFFLTEAEAKYELLNLTIEPVEEETVEEETVAETPAPAIATKRKKA